MDLFSMISNIDFEAIQGENKEIKGLAIDSRKVLKDYLFVCIEGLNVDSHDFAEKAVKSGASALLISHDINISDPDITIIKVKNTREALAFIASKFYREPEKSLKMIGVTGTNGKTSSTYFVESILREVYKTVGVIGTVGVKVNDEPLPIDFLTSTTPDTIELMEILKELNYKTPAVVMEVSSHALSLHKTDAINFDASIFTNITQDHLDFHKTFENYLDAKTKLFTQSKIGAINIDDPYSDVIIEKSDSKIITYSIDNKSDIKAENIKYRSGGVSFDVFLDDKRYGFEIKVPGKFTVYNALGAIAVSVGLGISMDTIVKGLKNVQGVPGRIQNVETNKDFGVIVDYAHTPDGLENIINSVREFTENRIITVFGCGGNRDKTKRPIMGKIAGSLSEFLILTSDNPRSETPETIIDQIEEGVKETNASYEKIPDRKKAIEYAIKSAKKGDTVIIAGKGHEDYQIFADKTIHFDDVEVAKEILEELK